MDEIIKEGKLSLKALLIRDILAMCILIGFYWLVRDLIICFTTKLNITNKRVQGRTGIIKIQELDSPLNKINGVKIEQDLFGRILNYGTVQIVTAPQHIISD